MNYLSAFLLFKNEEQYLKEWLDYHLSIKISHFYLYNNNSTDNFLEILEPYKDKITFIDWPGETRRSDAYTHACKNCDSKWLAIIDSDEFIFSPMNLDVPELLKKMEGYDSIEIFWQNFNSSGHIKKPSGPVLTSYTESYEDRHLKTIIQPKFMVSPIDSHRFLTANSKIKSLKRRVLRLNHYIVKSREECEFKNKRRGKDNSERVDFHIYWKRWNKPGKKDVEIINRLKEIENV